VACGTRQAVVDPFSALNLLPLTIMSDLVGHFVAFANKIRVVAICQD